MTAGKATSGRGDGDGPGIHVGAFGKHPGWDDHIDDIGLATDELVALKRIVYLQGVGGNVDAGAWDALDADRRLEGFRHLLLYDAGDAFLVARLWSSTDGKGRARYPMVAAVQCNGLPKAWALARCAEALADIETRCTATASAAEVIAVLDQWRGRLRRLAADAPAADPAGDDPAAAAGPLARVAGHPRWGGDRRPIVRVLYQVQREMAAFRVGARRGGSADDAPAALLRVPSLEDREDPYALAWLRLLRRQVDPSAPILQIMPLGRPWVDLLVGEPDARHLFCLRATPASVPLTTEVPYTIPPEFARRVDDAIAASAAGADERVTAGAAAEPATPRGRPARRPDAGAPAAVLSDAPSRRWLWIGLAAIAAVLLLLILRALFPQPDAAPADAPPPPIPATAPADLGSASRSLQTDWTTEQRRQAADHRRSLPSRRRQCAPHQSQCS
ncbi:MAG: hypothetical protein GX591_12860 [Planctomycetes bacterium]|nr:hypothetical protein [Planctomycetota bacterium]